MGFKKRPGPPTTVNGRPKKIKRSKKYWQQRKTVDLGAPVSDSSESSEEEEEDQEPKKSSYDELLSTFSKSSEVVVCSSSDDSEDEELEEELEGEELDGEELSEADEEDEEGEDEEGEEEEEEEEEEEGEGSNGEDEVEEEEEEQELFGDSTGGFSDPFIARFQLEVPEPVKESLEQKKFKSEVVHFEELGRCELRLLDFDEKEVRVKSAAKKLLEADEDDSEDIRKEQIRLMTNNKIDKLSVQLKEQISRNFNFDSLNKFPKEVFRILNSYKDFCYGERTHDNGEDLRLCYCLHALNHVLKTRTKILNNNAKVSTKSVVDSSRLRDQGLCRPKVLIIVPFRDSAKRIVDNFAKLLFGDETKSISNKARFDEDFYSESFLKRNKPDDFHETFAGNIDDSFKIGISVTKKSLKLYTDFYSSDIILASPLGLRLVIGVEGEAQRDYDFLSSIEILVMDQMDIFAMQNWDHVTQIMNHIHLKPVKSHGVDFSRVRMWTLNDLSKYYRQSILISAVNLPEINAIYNKYCFNYSGKIKVQNVILSGHICHVTAVVPMIFHRFESKSLVKSPDDRFAYFTNKVIPEFTKDSMYHTLIFIPSYFDFVKVRNWFVKSSYDFAEICEYTKDKKIAMARDNFFHNELHFILYTERCHFYRRFSIKGIRHLIFYQLPQYPHFYSELVNLMQSQYQNRKGGSEANMTCTVLYNKYDIHRLSAVTGSERASRMLQAERNVHMFVPDGK